MPEDANRHPGDPEEENKSDTQPVRRSFSPEGETRSLSDTQPTHATPPPGDEEGGGQPPPDEAETLNYEKTPDWESTPPPPLGETPPTPPPSTDISGMPLPRRVTERDVEATQVSGAAYAGATRPGTQTLPTGIRGKLDRWRKRFGKRFAGMGCLLRAAILAAFGLVLVGVLGVAAALYEYSAIASTLPSVEDLRAHSSQFQTTRILDADGNLLYEILDPNAGRRTYIPLEDISPYMVAATIATEDKAFYDNPGFSPDAILRAFWQNYSSGEVVSGASTITQQLARILLLDPEEASQQTYMRKVREAILAAEITRRYSKDEILELYFNEIYFGNLAYGVEAAAETYFGTTADQLDLGQASFLAGLPQAPSLYDIYTNRDVTLKRQQDVLKAMYALSEERNCIPVSNRAEPVCVSLDEAATVALDYMNYQFSSPDILMHYPHWVNYIRTLLEAQFDPQTIYRSGFTVYTTLEPDLQDMAQEIVAQQVEALADRKVGSGALVAIRPSDGHILAMVGSADFYNEDIDGQINMAVSPRQPGSSIKPLTYTAAFEKGWTPSTLIWDVRSEFPPSGNPDDPREPYVPVNYDNRYHGPVTVRTALANSYNMPAVKTLNFVGVYDNPGTEEEDGLVAFAHRMGITDLNADDYGLSLTLGGGEVKLLDLTNAYAIFANGGQRVTPVAITRIVNNQGDVVYEAPEPTGEQVIRPEHAFLISSILSDNDARRPSFGSNSVLNLPFQVAAKTGTTNDFRDNWTLGFTPDLAVGVWVGNPDFTPMEGTSGLTGAAPIWADFMQKAIDTLVDGQPQPFVKPEGVVQETVCTISGAEPSEWCPGTRTEYFAWDQPPKPKEEDLWQEVAIDTWTGLRATSDCSEFIDAKFAMNVQDEWAQKWLTDTSQGRSWAEDHGFDRPIFFTPAESCDKDTARPTVEIVSPENGDELVSDHVKIVIQVDAPEHFFQYTLDYAYGRRPDESDWETLYKKKNPVSDPTAVYNWDLRDVQRGVLSLRLRLRSDIDTYAERVIRLNIQLPTATPTVTYTPSQTPLPSDTPTPSMTPTATPTATQTLAATTTPSPTQTPANTSTFTPTLTPSPPPTNTPTLTPTP